MKTTELEPYTVIVEKAEGNYSAYVPELPGCVTTGETLEEIEEMIREAVAFHLEGLKEEGLPIPEINFDALRIVLAQESSTDLTPNPEHYRATLNISDRKKQNPSQTLLREWVRLNCFIDLLYRLVTGVKNLL
jgi:predicted RNase H-like HicB family nuclease